MLREEKVMARVDDHIVEPPGMFERHLPKDVVPRASATVNTTCS